MTCLIEVIEAGIGNCIQDAGRFGYRSIGVPVSGAADPILLACANRLLGNAPAEAGLEISLVGPRLRAVSGTLRIALAGALSGRVIRSNGSFFDLPAWQTATLFAGDTIALGAAAGGVAYLAISGGFRVPPQLGSRATYTRAQLGGIAGRALAAGDRLPCGSVSGDPWLEFRSEAPFAHPAGPLRVILGPQDDHFEAAALDVFLGQAFTVSRDTDRMGMRLNGPVLRHRAGSDGKSGADIVSDGVVPGAIQVPGNGLPIVLLADAQTVGGYPKIATVIRADLPRLAHLAPGAPVRFVAVTVAEARAAGRAQTAALAAWYAGIVSFRPPGVIDEAALYAENLISGMIDANAFRQAPDIDLPWEK